MFFEPRPVAAPTTGMTSAAKQLGANCEPWFAYRHFYNGAELGRHVARYGPPTPAIFSEADPRDLTASVAAFVDRPDRIILAISPASTAMAGETGYILYTITVIYQEPRDPNGGLPPDDDDTPF